MIIGVCGFIGSGKDTLSSYLVEHHGFVRLSFAGLLKDIVSVAFGWERKLLEGDTKQSRAFRDQTDVWWSSKLNMPQFTPRKALQLWGTDVIRKAFHDDFWIVALERQLLQYTQLGVHVVVSDCRFPNEVKAIKNLNGYVVFVHRNLPRWLEPYMQTFELIERSVKVNDVLLELIRDTVHASESSLLSIYLTPNLIDQVIPNTSTLEQFFTLTENLVNTLQKKQTNETFNKL